MPVEEISFWSERGINLAANHVNSRGNPKSAPAWLIFWVDFCVFEVDEVDFERQARYFLTLLYKSTKNTRQNDLPRSFRFEISPCQHEEKPLSGPQKFSQTRTPLVNRVDEGGEGSIYTS